MNLVDSCGWLEYFADSSYADFYAPAIEDTGILIVPTICILEVFNRVLQQRGEDAALQVVAVMHQGQVVPLSASIALRAAKVVDDAASRLSDLEQVSGGLALRARKLGSPVASCWWIGRC
jgi:toxin FitB